MLGSAVFAVAGIRAENPQAVVVYFSLSMGLLGLSEAPFWTTAVDFGGRKGGLTGAILNTGGNIGGALAPWLTPLVATEIKNYTQNEKLGWQCGIGLACLFCVIGAVIWLWIVPTEHEPGSADSTGGAVAPPL
jgi:ACS family glucarate transporter-like MFS transporter